MKRFVVVDRIECGYAVCENDQRRIENIELSKIEGVVSEGDVIAIEGNTMVIDPIETKKRKEEIEDLVKKIITD